MMEENKVSELSYPTLKADIKRCEKQLHAICEGKHDGTAIMSVPPDPTDFDMQFSAAFDELKAYRDTGVEPGDVFEMLAAFNMENKAKVALPAALAELEELKKRHDIFYDVAKRYTELGDYYHILDLLAAEKDGRLVVLPCKVGDTVYVIASCAEVSMFSDNDYFSGTGATECPFESTCDIEECDDDHIGIFKTHCTGFMLDYDEKMHTFVDHLIFDDEHPCWGKNVFLSLPKAKEALRKEKQ